MKKAAAIASVTAISTQGTNATPTNILSDERMGVLVDTTVCIGCRHCEWACKEAHNIPAGQLDEYHDRSVFKNFRRPNEKALTVVNEFENPKNKLSPIYVKAQCNHCDHPACVSACIVGAFSKFENGSVVWDGDKCIGCRYCMVACPFQVPTFEYEKAIEPRIMKCDFCIERTKKGMIPACVEICPMEVLTYGPRNEIIQLAKERISLYPNRYENYIYGEKEVGGTSWVYIGNRKMWELGMPKLKLSPAPGVSESIQHGIFAYFVPPIALYSLLGGIMWLTKKRSDLEEE
ncbi:MAG: 4Fe-4S dicluster domain-containing protein [Ignavibacteria bacterium]|nr:4Fe-4S dicluster domain-containing protein [Ignavibacteria bacterium]